jgi:hypothetical protein
VLGPRTEAWYPAADNFQIPVTARSYLASSHRWKAQRPMVNSKDDSHFLISHILQLEKQNSGHLGENAPFNSPVYYSAAGRIGSILSGCIRSAKLPFAYRKLKRNYQFCLNKNIRGSYSLQQEDCGWGRDGKLDDIKRKVPLKKTTKAVLMIQDQAKIWIR